MANTYSSKVVNTLPYNDPWGAFPFCLFFNVKENYQRLTGGGPKHITLLHWTQGPASSVQQCFWVKTTFHLASLHLALPTVTGEPL